MRARAEWAGVQSFDRLAHLHAQLDQVACHQLLQADGDDQVRFSGDYVGEGDAGGPASRVGDIHPRQLVLVVEGVGALHDNIAGFQLLRRRVKGDVHRYALFQDQVVHGRHRGQLLGGLRRLDPAGDKGGVVGLLSSDLFRHVGVGRALDDDDHTVGQRVLDDRHLGHGLADQPLRLRHREDRVRLDDLLRLRRKGESHEEELHAEHCEKDKGTLSYITSRHGSLPPFSV